jgi:glycosyltransferase involved in cell wall biosynthesis
MKKRILFIHHGSVAGGAPLSMLYTMQGMRDAGYEPLAALAKPSAELHDLYNSKGFATIEIPWMPIWITWSGSEGKRWNPYMWRGIYRAWRKWKNAHLKLEALLDDENIDIVHLNSAALSNPAALLMRLDRPFVWHVREHGPGHKGYRYGFLKDLILKADRVVFLSKAEQMSWTGANVHGTVVHNFINFEQFDAELPGQGVRDSLGIPADKKVILYVGGKKKHKGVFELLDGLGEVKKRLGDTFVCLMPDSAIDPVNPGKVGRRMLEMIQQKDLAENCILRPFDPNIVGLFAACDLLVFPATKPHFARPVIEASAMGKAVIASNLKAIDELVIDGVTGFLVDVNSKEALVDKLLILLQSEELRSEMGANGIKFARENFEYNSQMKKIIKIYENVEL